MFYKKKKKGATLAYVIVVLAIVAVIGTAIVSLSLSNYKAIIVDSKKTENLYMSESGLNEVQALLESISVEAVKAGNEKVAKEMANGNTAVSDVEKKQNEIFKSAYKEYIKNNVSDLFKYENDGVFLDNSKITDYKDGSYKIKLLEINNSKLDKENLNKSNLKQAFDFKNIDNKESISLRMNSKFNVKKGDETLNYKDVSLTFTIDVPDYNGAYYVETIPMYNTWSQGIVVGKNLNVQTSSNLKVNGGLIAAANLSGDDINNPNKSDKDIEGILLSGGSIYLTNGNLISKENIILDTNNSSLDVGENISEYYGVYTGNLGIYSSYTGDKGYVFANKEITNDNIKSNYPVYTMNDLILNGVSSNITLNSGFYGINSNTIENQFTNQKENSSAIIVNSKDIGEGSSIKIKDEALIMGSAYINTKGQAYQTGESVAIKGNYRAYTYDDGSGVTFKYYDPLQLADEINGKKLSVEDKAKYFEKVYKNIEGIKKEGISLPDNTTSIGVVINDGKVEVNNIYDLSKQNKVTDRVEKFDNAINMVGPLESSINIKNNISKFEEDKDLIYLNNEKGNSDSRNTLHITKGSNNYISPDNSQITLKKGEGNGIIITDRDVVIDSDIKFTGTIITTGNLSLKDGKTLDVTYDEEYLKNLIGNNYKDFKDVFIGNPDSNYEIVKSDNSLDSYMDSLVKRNNWEVN